MDDADHDCLHPEVIAGWHSLARWAKVLIPIGIGVVLSLTASAIDVRVAMQELEGDGVHASERRRENSDELRRLRTDLVRLERENALRAQEQMRAIVRLETKLEDIQRQVDRRGRLAR